MYLGNNVISNNTKNQESIEFICNFEDNNDLININSELIESIEYQTNKLNEEFNYSKKSANTCLNNLLK